MSRCAARARDGGRGTRVALHASSAYIPPLHSPSPRRLACFARAAMCAPRARAPLSAGATGWRNGSRARASASSSPTSTASTRSSSSACRSDAERPAAAPQRARARRPRRAGWRVSSARHAARACPVRAVSERRAMACPFPCAHLLCADARLRRLQGHDAGGPP